MTKQQDELLAVLIVIALVGLSIFANPWVLDYSNEIFFWGVAIFIVAVISKTIFEASQKLYWTVRRLIDNKRH